VVLGGSPPPPQDDWYQKLVFLVLVCHGFDILMVGSGLQSYLEAQRLNL
jgi:hypothetical protein